MVLNLNQKEMDLLKELGIEIKENYSDDDIFKLSENIADILVDEFDENYKPSERALILESILDKIADLD